MINQDILLLMNDELPLGMCKNLEESHGSICVKCNKCHRLTPDMICTNCGRRERSMGYYKDWKFIELYDLLATPICPSCQQYFTDAELGIGVKPWERIIVREYRSTFNRRDVVPTEMVTVVSVAPTIQDMAYTAGIVDGEGYIGIDLQNNHNGIHVPYYYARVAVSNTKESLVIWLKSKWGGTIRIRTSNTPKQKDCYVWCLSTGHCSSFLEIIHPYLLIKKPQSELVMSFSKLAPSTFRNSEHIRQQCIFYDEIKIMNKTGK